VSTPCNKYSNPGKVGFSEIQTANNERHRDVDDKNCFGGQRQTKQNKNKTKTKQKQNKNKKQQPYLRVLKKKDGERASLSRQSVGVSLGCR
jgi:hypothetical protein